MPSIDLLIFHLFMPTCWDKVQKNSTAVSHTSMSFNQQNLGKRLFAVLCNWLQILVPTAWARGFLWLWARVCVFDRCMKSFVTPNLGDKNADSLKVVIYGFAL